MSAGNHTYSRSEKLKSRKVLSTLFTGGKTISVFPVKLFWMPAGNTAGQPVQAGVGVSARHFAKAVDRNRIKRLLREGYRLNKQPLLTALKTHEKQIAVFFLYIGKELPDQVMLTEKMQQALTKLEEQIVR